MTSRIKLESIQGLTNSSTITANAAALVLKTSNNEKLRIDDTIQITGNTFITGTLRAGSFTLPGDQTIDKLTANTVHVAKKLTANVSGTNILTAQGPITAAKVSANSFGKIVTAGPITTPKVTANTVNATAANFTTLQADAIDFDGDLTVDGITANTIVANGGVSIDNITIDGTEIDLSSGDLTIDVAGDIILDADGSDISLRDGGTEFGRLSLASSGLQIFSPASDADIYFKGNDGGSTITALTLDMSDGGEANFGGGAAILGHAAVGGDNVATTRALTVVGATDGSSSSIIVAYNSSLASKFAVRDDGYTTVGGSLVVSGAITGTDLTIEDSTVAYTVNQTSGNLTGTFKGADLGTLEIQGTSSGGFIDIKQGDNDYDVRFGGNNTGGYLTTAGSFSASVGSTFAITGALSKSSGSFRIKHPLESKKDTHMLYHSFVESPQCNNIYRGKVTLSDGSATINIDTVSNMSEGTFVALNRDVQVFTTNETGWTAIKGSVSSNILTITAQESDCADTISWMVIGERQDPDIKSSALTDDEGNLIVERPNSEDPAHISQAAIDKQQTVYENGGL